jgi:hypothetical protein
MIVIAILLHPFLGFANLLCQPTTPRLRDAFVLDHDDNIALLDETGQEVEQVEGLLRRAYAENA